MHIQSRCSKSTHVVLDAEPLRALLHERPRGFGKPLNTWPLCLEAEVSFAQGLTLCQVSIETIRQGLKRLGVSWRQRHALDQQDRSPICL